MLTSLTSDDIRSTHGILMRKSLRYSPLFEKEEINPNFRLIYIKIFKQNILILLGNHDDQVCLMNSE